MIDFRYHLVSLVAMLFALAGGIALGSGPLQEPVQGELSAATSGDDADALREQLDSAEQLSDFQADYDTGTAGMVLGDRLQGSSVSMFVLPGADPTVVKELTDDLELADARLVSTVTLTDDLVDPAKRQLADSLVQGVLRGQDGLGATDDATGYQLVGATLAYAFLTRSTEPETPDDSGASILAAFDEAGFLQVDGAVEKSAQLALVVAGDPPEDAPDGQAEVVADLVAGLDLGDVGTVLVGSTASAADGAVAAVRDSDTAAGVSTVDAVETATGRLVGVLALDEQAAGGAGRYGPDGADGAMPDLDG